MIDLDVCASCGREDLPLIEQVSGAYSLCVRCETIARLEISEEPQQAADPTNMKKS